MQTVIELLLQIFLLIGFGLLLKKKGVIPDEIERGLNTFLLTGVLPMTVLASGDVTLTNELINGLLAVALLTAGYYVLSCFVLYKISRHVRTDADRRLMWVILCVYANTSFLGFPISSALFGEEGVLYCTVYNIGYQLSFFTWGVSMIAGKRQNGLRSLLRTPVTLASLATVLLVLTPLQLPTILQQAVSSVGSMTTPLSLILIGCSLSRIHLSSVFLNAWSWYVSGMRLVVLPMLMLAICWIFRVPHVPAVCCVVLTALPSGSLSAIYAERYQRAPNFAAQAVVQSTTLIGITFPALLFLLNRVW